MPQYKGVGVAGEPRLFISDAANGAAYLYGASGKLDARATSFVQPEGVAVDSSGRLYVADNGASRVLIYDTRLDSTPIVLRDPGQSPEGIAVDRHGNVAVTNFAFGASSVSFYRSGATTPTKTIGCVDFAGLETAAFDDRGNLYVGGEDPSDRAVIGVVTGGIAGRTIMPLRTANRIVFAGSVAVTSKGQLAIEDRVQRIVYTYAAPRNGSLGNPLSALPLRGSRDPVTIALDPRDANIYAVDEITSTASRYSMPTGALTARFNLPSGFPVGIAVTYQR